MKQAGSERPTGKTLQASAEVYVPGGVSSFFEICDLESDGTPILNRLRIGARGGGFIISRGSRTRASIASERGSDKVKINGRPAPSAKTSLRVIATMRKRYEIDPVLVEHEIEPPIGSGFGTSGSGAIGTAASISSLFDLRLTLSEICDVAHEAEIDSGTGLGTVISLASGSGAVGLVTEPGTYSVGRVDAIPTDYESLTLICAWFGSIENRSILGDEKKRKRVNEEGRRTLERILDDPTVESLLSHSRSFAEDSGLASSKLLKVADKAVDIGAIGATQNMLGKAVHCIVENSQRTAFLKAFRKYLPPASIFESPLVQSGLRIRNLPQHKI